jgi:cobalt-zinc-cadmium efflux system outer membrane protein
VQLAFLLGVRGPVPDFKVEQDLPKFHVPPKLASPSADALISEAMEHRPDLRAIGFQRDRALAGVALAKRLRFPDIALNVQYQQQAGFNETAVQPPTVSFGLSGTLPLFYFQRGEIERASADYRTQIVQHAKVEAQLVADVEGAFNAFVSTRKLVERMEGRLLERSRRARDLVSLQYQKGAASLLEYLDAQRTYIANNVEYLQDLANYWTAVYQLEAAVGMDLR